MLNTDQFWPGLGPYWNWAWWFGSCRTKVWWPQKNSTPSEANCPNRIEACTKASVFQCVRMYIRINISSLRGNVYMCHLEMHVMWLHWQLLLTSLWHLLFLFWRLFPFTYLVKDVCYWFVIVAIVTADVWSFGLLKVSMQFVLRSIVSLILGNVVSFRRW